MWLQYEVVKKDLKKFIQVRINAQKFAGSRIKHFSKNVYFKAVKYVQEKLAFYSAEHVQFVL